MVFIIQSLPKAIIDITGDITNYIKHTSTTGNEVIQLSGTNDTFILKMSSYEKKGRRIESEYNLLHALNNINNVGVPVPKTRLLVKTNDTCYMLVGYLAGNSLKTVCAASDINFKREEMIEAMGVVLKQIHSIRMYKNDPGEALDDLLKVATDNLLANVIDPEEFEGIECPETILLWLKKNRPRNLECVLLHGDYRPKNILWNNNTIAGVIDWEHSIVGDPHYDIAMMEYYLRSNSEKEIFRKAYGMETVDEFKLKYFDYLSKFVNV